MFLLSLSECRQINKSDYSCVIFVISPHYAIKTANFVFRVGYENDGGKIFHLTHFKEIKYIYEIDKKYLSVVIPLKPSLMVVFVELVDTHTGLSVVVVQRHGHYFNPYNLKETKETTILCDDSQTNNADKTTNAVGENEYALCDNDSTGEKFFERIIEITQDNEKGTAIQENVIVSKENEILSVGNLIHHQAFCKENNTLQCVTGIYYCNADHWALINNHLWLTPLQHALLPIKSSVTFPHILQIFHYEILQGMLDKRYATYGVLLDASLPSVTKPLLRGFPQDRIYQCVHKEVIQALMSVYKNELHNLKNTTVGYTDYKDSYVVFTREYLYKSNAPHHLFNPLSPFLNEYFKTRFHLSSYTKMVKTLGPTYHVPENVQPTQWTQFLVQNRKIVYVKHYNGLTVGEIPEHQPSLNDLSEKIYLIRKQLTDHHTLNWTAKQKKDITEAICKMIQLHLKHATITCHINVIDGLMYVDHSLFPLKRGILIEPPAPTKYELYTQSDTIVPQWDCLKGYTSYT